MQKAWLSFEVPGIPATSGSKVGFSYTSKVTGKRGIAMVPDNARQVPYMASVTAAAAAAMDEAGLVMLLGPVKLTVVIKFVRPAGHYSTAKYNFGELTSKAPRLPTGRPDSLKVCRAVEDAMSGVVYRDDSQIVQHDIRKVYGEAAATIIHVTEV